MSERPDDSSSPFGDLLKKIVRESKPRASTLKGRRLAQQALDGHLGKKAGRAAVASVKVGVVTLETDSSAMFQELEGYQKHTLIDLFRAAGLNVREIRVRLIPRK
jgi:hypothetical protein